MAKCGVVLKSTGEVATVISFATTGVETRAPFGVTLPAWVRQCAAESMWCNVYTGGEDISRVTKHWLHRGCSEESANALLIDAGLDDGRFLVREVKGIPNSWIVSVVHNGKPVHQLVEKHNHDDWSINFENTKKKAMAKASSGTGYSMDTIDDLVHVLSTNSVAAQLVTGGDWPTPLSLPVFESDSGWRSDSQAQRRTVVPLDLKLNNDSVLSKDTDVFFGQGSQVDVIIGGEKRYVNLVNGYSVLFGSCIKFWLFCKELGGQ
jgi:hypothetical protein